VRSLLRVSSPTPPTTSSMVRSWHPGKRIGLLTLDGDAVAGGFSLPDAPGTIVGGAGGLPLGVQPRSSRGLPRRSSRPSRPADDPCRRRRRGHCDRRKCHCRPGQAELAAAFLAQRRQPGLVARGRWRAAHRPAARHPGAPRLGGAAPVPHARAYLTVREPPKYMAPKLASDSSATLGCACSTTCRSFPRKVSGLAFKARIIFGLGAFRVPTGLPPGQAAPSGASDLLSFWRLDTVNLPCRQVAQLGPLEPSIPRERRSVDEQRSTFPSP
jgi:hypothetical protein